MNILIKLSPPKPSKVYDTYWRFAAERQKIFFARIENALSPWTDDPILREYKFTNAYRAADRVSQYLIREVLYKGDQSLNEVFFRCLLFKIFNRESTWELLLRELGEIRFSTFSFKECGQILERARSVGKRIFSAAYIMPSHGEGFNHSAKHRNYLGVLEKMMADGLPSKLAAGKTMQSAFGLLLEYPLIGSFLAYQFATDINYSVITNFSEMEFVVAGPGAKDGIRKCFTEFGDFNEADIIRLVAERQDEEFGRLALDFRNLWGRPLQLIDCQNLFCEISKYARIAHPEVRGLSDRKRIKQKFTANPQVVHYGFPPKWGINPDEQPLVHSQGSFMLL